jgi:hypothetical protein
VVCENKYIKIKATNKKAAENIFFIKVINYFLIPSNLNYDSKFLIRFNADWKNNTANIGYSLIALFV